MEDLSLNSKNKYESLVKNNADFIKYFRLVTPEPELPLLKIGSRPARRNKNHGITSLRAIPWIFAWTQNRFLLPSWLGVGEALDKAAKEGQLDELKKMYNQWAFFSATMGLIEMVLGKADLKIGKIYESELAPPDLYYLGDEICNSFAITKNRLLEITGHNNLLEDLPVLARSIEVRNPYVDPLNFLQVEFLRLVRQTKEQNPAVLDALLTTMNGVAAGMRNTG